ncbi:unnamed protein product [Oikopleura dioica]|uniref:LITAF domain-containing protein n=1 Tax=Oikopleura dioica TaxID=34765 RepID=E4YKX8_OIKDI|nr:unnamed protein product [Oikopleura dioica]
MAAHPSYNPNFDSNYGSQWGSTAPPPPYGNAPLPGQPPVNIQPMPITLTNPDRLSTHSMVCVCPHCRYEGESVITKVTGWGNHLAACGTCVFGLWAGCCLISYYLDILKDTEHQCANCKKLIGIKKILY